MALQGPSIGDAYIDIHGNTNPFERDVEKGLKGTTKDAEQILDEIGTNWGNVLSKSTSRELEKHGKEFGHAIEHATESVTVKVRSKYDIDNNVSRDRFGRFARKIAINMEDEIGKAIKSASGPGGPFQSIGTAIRDAIGAGFNISGQSPLIPLLAIGVADIIALVLGALQIVNALVAVIATLPGLLVAVGVQAGIVLLAFHGMGAAIQGALAAKNAKELNEAIKDLTPSAQAFVKEIVGAKDAFKEIQKIAQEGFFRGLGNIIDPLVSVLQAARGGIGNLARDLGEFFRGIALFFASPSFRQFLTDVLPATGKFLDRFGPAFVSFLTGLIKFADAALPFLNIIGGIASNIFAGWGRDLAKIAKDPATLKWFSDMEDTLQSVRDLLGAVTDFIAVLLKDINEQGGIGIIDELAKAFDQIAFFLSTDAGKTAIKDLIDFGILAIQVTFGLLEAILSLIAAVHWVLNTGIPFLIEAVTTFVEAVALGFVVVGGLIANFFTWLTARGNAFFQWIGQGILDVAHAIGKFFSDLGDSVTNTFDDAVALVRSLPDKIVAIFKDAAGLLFGAGRRVIGGFISGIKDAIPDMVKALEEATKQIPEHKGPEEKDRKLLVPAGKAVMEGFQAGLTSGAQDIRTMLTDFTSQLGGFGIGGGNTGITFGRDSIRISFEGALPTEQQAMTTGVAVGNGINGVLAQRNTRLAVRTL